MSKLIARLKLERYRDQLIGDIYLIDPIPFIVLEYHFDYDEWKYQKVGSFLDYTIINL